MSSVERDAPRLALELRSVARAFRVGLGFKRREVLHGVDLAVPSGTTLGLVGPNGSGKSTLLRLMAGVDRPTAGSVRALGGDPLDSATRARLAYLPEDSPFPRELTALAVLELFGALQALPKALVHAHASALLARVGLADCSSVPLRSYSRGMLRRFGLAQAFLNKPELVLLDEPTAGLDAPGFGVLEDLLDEARERGATTVLASHVLSDIHDHCDLLAIVIAGRVVASGPPASFLGVEGQTELTVAGLDEADRAALVEWVANQGGEVVNTRAAQRSLLDVYREHQGDV